MRKGEIIGVGRFLEAQQRRDENAVSPLDEDPGVLLVLTSKEIMPVDPDSYLNPKFIATELPKIKSVRQRKSPGIPQA